MKANHWLGKVIESFEFRHDSGTFDIIAYHPKVVVGSTVTNQIDTSKIMYHCEQINHSWDSLDILYLQIMVEARLGLNNMGLVAGLARALAIKEAEGLP